VIEVKKAGITTHSLLTYAAKAERHKQVYPYLRYGIVVGRSPGGVERKWLFHGSQFDFMVALASFLPTKREADHLAAILTEEVQMSRRLGEILASPRKKASSVVRRRLEL